MSLNRRILFALVIGLGGLATLLSLGFWQAGRLSEKQAQIALLESRMSAAPVMLGREPPPEDPDYRRARAEGGFAPDRQALVLTTRRPFGPGHLVISVFELADGGRILVDRGFAPDGEAERAPAGRFALSGVLRAPNEVGYFTPPPDLDASLFFARDVEALAAHLGAAPILLVLDAPPALGSDAAPARFPQPTRVAVDLPNDHFGYAVTWFSLAAIWAAMTGLFVWRGRR